MLKDKYPMFQTTLSEYKLTIHVYKFLGDADWQNHPVFADDWWNLVEYSAAHT